MITFCWFFLAIGGAMALHEMRLTTTSRTILNISSDLNTSSAELHGEDFRGYNHTGGAVFRSHEFLHNETAILAMPVHSVKNQSFQSDRFQPGFDGEDGTIPSYVGRSSSRRRSFDELEDATQGSLQAARRSPVMDSTPGLWEFARNTSADILTPITHYFSDEGKISGSEYYYPEKSLAEPWLIVRHEGFSHAVYRVPDKFSEQEAYFSPPALIIRANSAVLRPSSRPNRLPGITLAVEMWSVEYEEMVMNAVRKKLSFTQEPDVRMLPVQFIKVSGQDFQGLSVPNQWMSYAGQPARFEIRLNCESNATCFDYVQFLSVDPATFIHDHDLKLLLNLDPRKQKVDMESHLKAPTYLVGAKVSSAVATTERSTSFATTEPSTSPSTTEPWTSTSTTTPSTTTEFPQLRPSEPLMVPGWDARCPDTYRTIPKVKTVRQCAFALHTGTKATMAIYDEKDCWITVRPTRCNFYRSSNHTIVADRNIPTTVEKEGFYPSMGLALPSVDPEAVIRDQGGQLAVPSSMDVTPVECLKLCKAHPLCDVAAHTQEQCTLMQAPVTTHSQIKLLPQVGSTTFILNQPRTIIDP